MKKYILITAFAISFLLISCGTPPRTTVVGIGNEGLIGVYCDPDDASLFVDDVYQGPTKQFDGKPGYLELSPGPHKIRIEKEGYHIFRTDVYIGPDREDIKVRLRKK